jgi:protein-tyrosine kinase
MSTLEKAYLKAMEEELSPNDYSQNTANADKRVIKPKKASDIGNSRSSIKRMDQRVIYTPEQLQAKRLISASMKDTRLLDSYRNLRTKLLATSNKDNFTTMVTSVVPEADSSLVAANLAATFALDEGKTALLIDANIHQPRLNQLFDFHSELGLIDYLESEDWESSQALHETAIPRLRLVPSGLLRENSAEYFTSDKMHHFVNELTTRYPDRFPIINAPSITFSADTRILVDLCDRVVLVVPYGLCSEDDIMKAVLSIGKNKLAGVVLNEF